MAATFNIPGPLRQFTDGRSEVEVEPAGPHLSDALAALWLLYPGIRDRIATEQGQIRQHVNIFVGNDDIRYTGGLATPIPAGADIWIVPSISGGAE